MLDIKFIRENKEIVKKFKETIKSEKLFLKEMPSNFKSMERFFHYRNPFDIKI